MYSLKKTLIRKKPIASKNMLSLQNIVSPLNGKKYICIIRSSQGAKNEHYIPDKDILLLPPSFKRKRTFEIIFVIIIIYSHKLKLEIFSPNIERPCKIQINFANHNAKNLENQIWPE